jgi:glucosamine kinase
VKGIHIIADGGGTSTNWCISANGKRTFFSTESYHPSNWNSQFEARIKAFWQDKIEITNTKLTFFGAGCFKEARRQEAHALFTRVGFNDISIFSDLHAAAIACLGSQAGWVLIAGTGSVLFEWDGKEVQQIIGGKGHELGDEGSGFYFGKLILQALDDGELSSSQEELVRKALAKKEFATENEKYAVASLAQSLGAHKDLFAAYHLKNVRAFFKSHAIENGPKEMHIVGGYASHNQDVYTSVSSEYSIRVCEFIYEPIVPLVERMDDLSE